MTGETYNFRKPGRLDSDLEQRLVGWLRDGCELLPAMSQRELAAPVTTRFQGLEIQRPSEGLARLPDSASAFSTIIEPPGLKGLLVLSRPLALALVASALGEAGTELPADRALTVVEESLLEYLVQHVLLAALHDTWPGPEPLAIDLGGKEAHPRRTRIFPPGENVVACAFTLRGPFGEQPWYWVVPQKGLLEELARAGQSPRVGSEEATQERLQAAVRELPVSLSVVLGTAALPLSQLARLEPGDVILLDQRVSEPLQALVAALPKFRVWPGRIGARRAVQIQSLPEG